MGSEPSSEADGLDAKLDRAVPGGDAVAFLIAIAGDQPGRVYPLARNTVSIGRVEEADIHISDPSVSGRHAQIISGSQGFEIEDLGSTNGTFVGEQRIARSRLRNGDVVRLGNAEFNFLNDRPVEATVALMPPGTWVPAPSSGGALMRLPDPRFLPPPPSSIRFEPQDEAPSLLELVRRWVVWYRFLHRYRVLIGILAVLGATLGFASILALPPGSVAVSEVRFRPQMKSNPVETDRTTEESLQFFRGPERALTNPELVRVTLRRLDNAEPGDTKVESVAARLKFENLDEPHLYRVSYKEGLVGSRQPPAVPFLTAHLESYVQSEITKALTVFTAGAEFLRNQMKSVEKEMTQLGAERTKFRQANADRLPEEAVQTHSSRFQLESRRADLQAQVRRLQGELDVARRQLRTEGPLAQTKFQSSQVYRQSLAAANQKLSEAYARGLADGHPEVRQLNDEKQRIEALIQGEMHAETTQIDREASAGFQALQGRVESLQGQLGAARSDLADTQRSLGQVRSVVGDLPRVEERVQALSHQQEATNRLHAQLFEKLKKAELQVSLERVSAESRYEMIKAPQLEKGGRLKNAAIRCGLGLLAGLFLAALVMAIRQGRQLVFESLATLENRGDSSWR